MEEYVETIIEDTEESEIIEFYEDLDESLKIFENVLNEVDPTVPSWVKEITQEDIDRWNKEEVVINSISDKTIEEIVNGSYIPDEDDTTSILGKAILGTMVLQ